MLKTLLKALGFMVFWIWFNLAGAASMGGINVTSALGHPLKAEISLDESAKNEKSSLVAKLATVNEFKNAGLDFPYSLPHINFAIDERANGEIFIKLTSSQPVNEPYVSILIELSWSSGKLLREYTFLLDPPGFAPEQPKQAEVKPVEPMVPVVEAPTAAAMVPVPEPLVTPVPVPLPMASDEKTQAIVAESAPAQAEVVAAELAPVEKILAENGKTQAAEPVKMEPLAPSPQVAAVESILIEKGDTLGKIADEIKPVDVSLERMLVAMYRANAQKFEGKNMNRIRAGKILRMPDASEIAKISQAAAVKEIRAQVADWQDYRQKLAAAQSVSAEAAPKQEAAGKISAAVAEKSPVIKESAKEVLRLSKGEALGDKTVAGGGARSEQEKRANKADEAAAKSRQLQEEQKKIAKLESIGKDVNKLVELKGKGLTAAQEELDGMKSALPASAPAAVLKKTTAASAVAATKPAEADTDYWAMLSGYLAAMQEDPVILGGMFAVLLGLGGLGFVMSRRGKAGQKKSNKKNTEVGSTTGSWRTPVAPSPDTGDFTQAVASEVPVAPMVVATAIDDVDPISEADLFLNFGRDAQAEEILKDALSTNPENLQVKLKLLSIYANRKDSNSFSKYAQEIKDSGDAAAWERAAVMGRELDPANPNYGDAKGEARQREATPVEVDFDLSLDKQPTPKAAAPVTDFKMDFDVVGDKSAATENPVDFDVPFAKPAGLSQAKLVADVDATSILSKEAVNSAQADTPMDFDVSGILPNDVKGIEQSSKMDLDVTGILPGDVKDIAQATTMDFDLTGSDLESVPAISGAAAIEEPLSSSLNFDNLDFDIPPSTSKPAQEKTVADESLAFSIDFPETDVSGQPAAKPVTPNKLDIDFGDININLEESTGAPAANAGEAKDEHWHEVATKLDLAKAYQEMGDADGAREILDEVMRDGDESQRESADKLMQQITG